MSNELITVEYTKKGTGRPATVGDRLLVDYKGTLDNGRVFDSSYERDHPFTFTLGDQGLIKCWNRGLENVPAGSRVKLTCDAKVAYGSRGVPQAGIPPRATLHFDIELHQAKPMQ